MTLNRKGHLDGKWIIVASILPGGDPQSLTTTRMCSIALLWGLKVSLGCGSTKDVLYRVFTCARNRLMVSVTSFFMNNKCYIS